MVPGMGHCGGGPGPTDFGNGAAEPGTPVDADHDVLMALDRWVTQGVAPDKLIGTGKIGADAKTGSAGVRLTRPLCAYPRWLITRPGRHQRRRQLRVRSGTAQLSFGSLDVEQSGCPILAAYLFFAARWESTKSCAWRLILQLQIEDSGGSRGFLPPERWRICVALRPGPSPVFNELSEINCKP